MLSWVMESQSSHSSAAGKGANVEGLAELDHLLAALSHFDGALTCASINDASAGVTTVACRRIAAQS